jgi:hypothetical protein
VRRFGTVAFALPSATVSIGIFSLAAVRATVAASTPALAAPSESRTIAAGECLGFSPWRSWRASCSASPVAVAPSAVWASMIARAAEWFVTGPWTASGELENATAPMATLPGSWSMNVLAAFSAASRRVGATSLAAIEPE